MASSTTTPGVDIGRNVGLLTDHNLEAGRGEQAAVITADDRVVTYAEVHAIASRLAGHLLERGIRREQRVVLVLDDTPAFHAAFLGAMRVGIVPVPVNFLARAEDFGYFLRDSYAELAIVDEAFLDMVGPQAEQAGVPVAVANGTSAEDDLLVDRWLEDGEDHIDTVDSHPADMAFWLYSSGSTGAPKGVVHRQSDVAFTCRNYAETLLGLRTGEVTFSTTKLFHAYGLGNGLTFPMWMGATAVMMTGRPAPDRALDRIEAHRPTVLYSVPTLYNAMLSEPDIDQRDLSSLRVGVSAAEALPPEIWRQWHERTGTEILDGIGSTELLHIYCSNRPGEVEPGSSGQAVPGYELALRDPDGVILDGPAVGELMVRGESALAYYWHNREKTQNQVLGAWFASSDRYRRDDDGNYWYEGRVDDMMKVGGLWVSPIEIENRLMEHAAVQEAAVVGVEADGLTVIKSVVILRGDHHGDDALANELQNWCKDGLQRYQFPRVVQFAEDLPRTATGKIQRFKLRDDA